MHVLQSHLVNIMLTATILDVDKDGILEFLRRKIGSISFMKVLVANINYEENIQDTGEK